MDQYIPGFNLIGDIGKVLGRRIAPSEWGNRNSFADFTESDIDDFRLLGKATGVFAVAYIRSRLKGDVGLRAAVDYYSLVIQQGMPADEWVQENHDNI